MNILLFYIFDIYSGPGINNDADIKLHHHVSNFEGNTNTGTNEVSYYLLYRFQTSVNVIAIRD